jgi:hypothetical protein
MGIYRYIHAALFLGHLITGDYEKRMERERKKNNAILLLFLFFCSCISVNILSGSPGCMF